MRADEARSVQPDVVALQAGLLALSEELHGAVDQGGRLRYLNAALAARLGASAQHLLGQPLAAQAPAQERARLEQGLRDARQSGGVVRWECGWPGAAGTERVAWRAQLQPETGLVLVTARDETALRRSRREREEQALLESERRYRSLVEGSLQGIVILRGRKPLFANESFARIFGYERQEEIVGLASVNVLAAPHEAARMNAYAQARLHGEYAPEQYEFEGVRKDGTHIWLDCLVKVVQWEGAPAIQCANYDITPRKRAEQQLRAQQRLMQTVFDTVPHLLFVKDRDGNYLMANAAWLTHHGHGPEAMVGRNTLALEHRPLPDRERARALDLEVLRAGRLIEAEYERTVADGSRRTYRNYRAPLRDEAGEIVGTVGISEDITGQRRAEEALRASQRLLRLVVDTLPHNIFVKGLDGRYVMANRAMAEFHQLAPEQVLGRTLAELPGPRPEQVDLLSETDRQVLAANRLMSWPEVAITGADGQLAYHAIHKLPLHDDQGRVQGIVCLSEDITARKRAEEESRASQRLLRTVMDALPHNIYVKDLDGRYLLVNRSMAAFHKLTPEDLIGKRLEELTLPQPEQVRWLLETDRQVIEAGRMLDWADLRVTLTDGRTTIRRLHKLPLRDGEGRIQGVVGISQDITQEKHIEEQLRASHRLLQTVIDTVPNLLTVKDREGRYLLVNKAWIAHFGVPAAQALGHTLEELGVRPARDTEHVRSMDEEVLLRGKAFVQREYARQLPDGSVEHYLNFRTPLRDDAGAVTGVVGTVVDVTVLKRVEEELRASRQLLQTAFDLMPIWVFVKDTHSRIGMVNRRMLDDHGLTPDAVVREKPKFLSTGLTDEQRRMYDALDRRVLETRQQAELVGDVTLPNGETRRYRTIRVPLLGDGGEPVGIVGISEDVTERERAQRAMQQAQKLESLGVLAGGIAHDFNNLLVSVLGYAHLAATELPHDSPVQPLVRHIETAGRRASDLCNQMLAYAGKASFQVSRVQLNELIREMTELMGVSLTRNIRLLFDFAERLPELEVDATQLRQVVMNLVINASEAIGERPGAITVRTGVRQVDAAMLREFVTDPDLPEGPYVFLEVTDTGSGMDADTLNRIFDPFFTTKFSGRGLGLAAVLGIVRGHAGALRVASTPGAGTMFCLLLPPAQGIAKAPAERESPAPFRGSGTVLVVDDEPAIRELIELVLQALGFVVATAGDGNAALEAARRLDSALCAVLMDVGMPGLSSEETLRGMREAGLQAPVIVMSGHAATEVRERFAGLPVAAFLAKPFTGADVRARLEQVLGRTET
jgi:PAS domain S-box-containing protein